MKMCFILRILYFLLNLVPVIFSDSIISQNAEDFWDETEPFGQGPPSPDLRLPPYVVPSFYRLKLKADLENSSFTGEVYITIRPNKSVKEIILHAKDLSISSNAKLTEQIYEQVETTASRTKRDVNSTDIPENNQTLSTIATDHLNITSATEPQSTVNNTEQTTEYASTESSPVFVTQVTHSSVRSINITSVKKGTGDRLILQLDTALTPNVDYTLELSFDGNISDSLMGFYKSSYTTNDNEVRELAVTQFEPTSARAAFPCFDEPAFKAKFEISIAHPDNITVLSNMKVATQESIEDQPGWQWTHFERSVSMSTYLVAYALSDFKSTETSYLSKDNITKTIRIWTRPEYVNKAKYAATITPKLLAYYEDVFGVPYALDKMDLIAVPDFSNGAMENWGLITFRETTLLFDEKEAVPREKRNVAVDVAHELAHQWFGNLVTMRWWTDLWLNEGFATYIEYIGVNHIEPEWNMFETFTRDKMELLRSDSLKNTSPVSRQVVDASEISQKFDEISYSKGASLIRMLNHTISDKLFHDGLVVYLNNWKYQNAEENDLWQSMSEATKSDPAFKNLSVVEFMNSWTKQAGYPVVNVNRNYETGYVDFEQHLFSMTKEPYKSSVQQMWKIPISLAGVHAPSAWSTRPRLWLTDRHAGIQLDVNASEALYVNVDAIGYYRVNYDQKNWALLREALKTDAVTPIMKAQLIDDAFNLAKTNLLNYSYALDLTTCVIDGENSKIVWDVLLGSMGPLHFNLRATSGYMYFQDYMRILLSEQLQRVNYGLDKPKDDNEAFLIDNLVTWECIVEAPRCLRWAQEQFSGWRARANLTDNPIPSYLRPLVYSIAVKHGGRPNFEWLWRVFLNSTDPSVRTEAISSLPSTTDEGLVQLLLERSLSEIPKQYAITAWGVSPPVGARVAQNFLIDNFDRVYDTFTGIDPFMFSSVLNSAFSGVSTEDELERLKKFAVQHKEKLQPMSQTLQKMVDTAHVRIDWIRTHAPTINAWLKEYVTKHTQASTTTLPTTGDFTTNTSPSTVAGEDITTEPDTHNTTTL